jgi:hypothetical protein
MSDHEILNSLVPRPKEVSFQKGRLVLQTAAPVTADFAEAAKLKYLLGLCGFEREPKVGTPVDPRSGMLHLAIGDVAPDGLAGLAPTLAGEEAYALWIDERAVRLAARSLAGMAHGLKTLAKLACGRPELPAMLIQDAPALAFRGLHLCIFDPNDGTEKEDTRPEQIRSMLRLAAMTGYRYAFLEFWGMFPYQRRPYAVWPNTLYTPEVVRGIIDYAIDDLHLRVLPCQNLTSHAGWSRIISRRHVVLDQRPELAEMWIPGGWCFATENPNTKAFLRDVIEELLDAFRQPPMFHVCCDKAFGFGSTEEDRTRPADLLFGNHLCFLNSTLQHHGTRMVMWADMLYSSMDALYWKASPTLVDMLPRNILMNLWTHNDPGVHWADVEFFERRGFQTIYSPFLDRRGVASMTDVCLRRGSHGILQTTWHRPQTARPSMVYSGAYQWEGSEPHGLDADAVIARWCRAFPLGPA